MIIRELIEKLEEIEKAAKELQRELEESKKEIQKLRREYDVQKRLASQLAVRNQDLAEALIESIEILATLGKLLGVRTDG